MSEEPPVELMEADQSLSISDLYNAQTGEYFAPLPTEQYKEVIKLFYLISPGATEQRSNQTWPYIWQLTETVYKSPGLTAFLDTGFCPHIRF
jgi:hypothetical protein